MLKVVDAILIVLLFINLVDWHMYVDIIHSSIIYTINGVSYFYWWISLAHLTFAVDLEVTSNTQCTIHTIANT